MARYEQTKVSNPTAKYLDWDQHEQSYSYWDSTLDPPARVAVNLPFRFLVIRQSVVVMGFTENKDRIYSNELFDEEIGFKDFYVRTKDGVIAQGLWRNIKPLAEENGAKLCKIIHAVCDNEIVCIRVKGKGWSSWINTVGSKKHAERIPDELITVTGFEESEFDGEKYTYPTFGFAGSLNVTQNNKVNELDRKLDKYYFNLAEEKARRAAQNPQYQVQTDQYQKPAPAPQQPARNLMPTPAPAELFAPAGEDDDLPF